jgi:hypothetical protein
MITFSKTDNSLTVIFIGDDGRNQVLTATAKHPRWKQIVKALSDQDEERLIELMSVKTAIENYTDAQIEIKNHSVFFKGRQLHGLDVNRLIQFATEGVPFLPMARFLEKKIKNPSFRAVNELYKFLEHKHMPITPRGTILGYKGVKEDMYSVMGNTATVIISGTTDSGGHIYNGVGESIRCDRNCVSDDYRVGCSPGLHIGSLEYAKSWASRVIIVEFDPEDVVCVPEDCECQKLRACAYKVVGEYTGEMPDSYLDKYDEDEANNLDNDEDSNISEGEDVVEDIRSDEVSEDSYSNGWADGIKDGKAHSRRKHYVTDVESTDLTEKEREYITGYNGGYKKGRYNKGRKRSGGKK